ncbi:hypothetical protein P7M11_09035, partial [Bisgaard Taxon 10/6]|uniref:hypothetical protein n=1 Tax=Exercitatus varius TaxID=67857 RepID=UPI00294ACAE7
TAIANTGYQLFQDRPYDPYGLLQAELSTVLTRNRSLGQQVSINVGISTLSAENDEDYGWNALGAGLGTLGAKYSGKFKIGNQYFDNFATPIISGVLGDGLSDKENIKDIHNNLMEGYLNEKK